MKSKPQGLFSKNLFKTLRRKYVILAIALVFFAAAAIFLSSPQKDKNIKLNITAEGAGFKANFFFPDDKRAEIEHFLESINAPTALLDGVEFELESTASSALAFALPVDANLKIQEKEIAFWGSHTYPNVANADIERFKLSPDTNLAVFTPSAREFVKNSQNLPLEFSGWLDENLNSQKGYYISVFGEDSSMLVIFQPEKIDLEGLSGLEFKGVEGSSYKKEKMTGDSDVHFVKLDDEKDLSVAIFEKDSWVYLIFSEGSLQEKIDFYLAESPDSVEFPKTADDSASFVIWFKNKGDYIVPSKLYRLLFGQNLESTEALAKIDEAQFSLLGNAFSGLIKFK